MLLFTSVNYNKTGAHLQETYSECVYRFMQVRTKIAFTRKSAFRYPRVFWTISPKLYKQSLSFLCSDAAKITEHADLVNGKLRSCALCPICSWTVTYICIAKSMHIDTQLGVVSRLPQHNSIYSLYTVYMQPSNHKWTELAIPCALQKFRSLARSKDKLKAWPFGPKRRPPLLDTVHKDPVQTHLSFPFVVERSSCL